jgi:hypothetical protein
MISELFIENFRVDISADISSLLTFAIDDVKDFASRQTTFSKTVVLPGTNNNNALFGNIFETGSSNDYDSSIDNIGYNFNAAKSARCLIFQDNLQTFKGTLRLLQINKDKKNIEYEVALNGELTNLNVALSSGFLTDLDFSAYDELFKVANITASWDNPGGSGLFYPLIDYGLCSTAKDDWDIQALRPALYAKEYIDKMFTAAGYRYSSNLFSTARFKSLIIPHNQKVLQRLASELLTGDRTTPYDVLNSGLGTTANNFELESFTSTVFTYSAGPQKYTYTGATTLNMTIVYLIAGMRSASSGLTQLRIRIRKNGVDQAATLQTYTAPPTPVSYTFSGSITLAIATGDYIEFGYDSNGAGGSYIMTADSATVTITSDTATYVPVANGDTLQINATIPKNIRQVDFLLSIVKLFNLYVYESQFDERLIYIEPFVDFYSTDSGNAVDWTYKLNRDSVVKIKPMSELNSKIYNFRYASDSDYYNDQYKKRYNQGYGSYVFDSAFEFASQENNLELIFAATPLVGYSGEDKVFSTIFKQSNGTEERIDSVIRILQTKKITGVTSWDIKDGVSVLTSTTNYGYAGHFDDPDNPGNDLNFGVLNELYFILATGDLTKTQFNLYWSSYMAEITDKDSKMLIGKFYLTPKDIFDLDFSKYVYLDGVLFRLNKITDYNTTTPSDCEVQLLRVINTIY